MFYRQEIALDHVYDDYKPQKVFVYGTLKKGYGNNLLLTRGDSVYIDDAQSIDYTYQMCSNGGFPMVKDNLIESDNANAILGELYQVNDMQTFFALDTLESNGTLYQREQRDFACLEDGKLVTAWIYLYLPDMPDDSESFFYFSKSMKSGQDVLTFPSWIDEEKMVSFWQSKR